MNYKFDFVKHSKLYFAVSLGLIVIGILSLLISGLNLGVDFKAGTSLDIISTQSMERERAEQIVRDAGFETAVTIGGDSGLRASMRFDRVLNADEISSIMNGFKTVYGEGISYEENTVDPTIAKELGMKAIYAMLAACIGISIYVSIRFEWRFATASVLTLAHDGFLVIALFSLFRLEVNLPFVAAVLTIIGYSINDKIVIFDRIRDNLRFAKLKTEQDLSDLVNRSIWQTLVRSLNTGITILFASFCLYIFGSESIRLFSLAMTIGLVIGIFSSIFIAGQFWIVLRKKALNKPAMADKPQ